MGDSLGLHADSPSEIIRMYQGRSAGSMVHLVEKCLTILWAIL